MLLLRFDLTGHAASIDTVQREHLTRQLALFLGAATTATLLSFSDVTLHDGSSHEGVLRINATVRQQTGGRRVADMLASLLRTVNGASPRERLARTLHVEMRSEVTASLGAELVREGDGGSGADGGEAVDGDSVIVDGGAAALSRGDGDAQEAGDSSSAIVSAVVIVGSVVVALVLTALCVIMRRMRRMEQSVWRPSSTSVVQSLFGSRMQTSPVVEVTPAAASSNIARIELELQDKGLGARSSTTSYVRPTQVPVVSHGPAVQVPGVQHTRVQVQHSTLPPQQTLPPPQIHAAAAAPIVSATHDDAAGLAPLQIAPHSLQDESKI